MSFPPIYEGWDIPGRLSRRLRRTFFGLGLSRDVLAAQAASNKIAANLQQAGLGTETGRFDLANQIAANVMARLGIAANDDQPLRQHLSNLAAALIDYEAWFELPAPGDDLPDTRSELWELEDQLKRVEAIANDLDEVTELAAAFLFQAYELVIEQQPSLLHDVVGDHEALSFDTRFVDGLDELPALVEHLLHLPHQPEFEPLVLFPHSRQRLEYNLHLASGGAPGGGEPFRSPKLPTKQSNLSADRLVETYLGGTPLAFLFDLSVPITLPTVTRFEHHHIVAGSGHGKTQTLQHLILHDLEAVSRGEASIIVIDSQSDLINNIAGLSLFAPGEPLSDRLVLIDPTDVEYPVALNLFDAGLERLDQYSQLDRERLTNSILELYDFVLGSLLDAGMTQKQTVIFRYITRLLLRIPGATIHTLRELLEEGGYDRYREHIDKLEGSAKAFFEQEFEGREFAATKRQVLRRLYGILENQTFERMFSHPKSKLDLFAEMNAGKVILINTAKDLLKENGAEIFGRFFIAMITQAAQERAILGKDKRLPTFVYVDEANDYFDRNIGIILSQARKYNIGMVLAHQFLGQLDTKLNEAIAANTSIKFAGGVSAKDARALAAEMRTDPGFIESQDKLSFAAFIKGQTKRSASIGIEPGQMEQLSRMNDEDRDVLRDAMREKYAVHYSELAPEAETDDDEEATAEEPTGNSSDGDEEGPSDDEPDTGEPMKW